MLEFVARQNNRYGVCVNVELTAGERTAKGLGACAAEVRRALDGANQRGLDQDTMSLVVIPKASATVVCRVSALTNVNADEPMRVTNSCADAT